ncbi:MULTISPECIES: ABC transporter ATP-binding protein [unclassified Rothia (in: high G+C Gram-positive bacteria)]|uniref:ABC transporter ATP-binding protein n=1 Tax=unclassified Rothia (in: high G+C Gram-positive bacteria) TaxID=2689056 RepID=UPI00195A3DF1|nr:ABC transporter ATP-binding protein [Rothia sp. ZJ932]MBM7051554.1 ABC transporter ATP-binding protein [Rothia sp. ZJ1223]QRZ61854.1 ABC transporter ATP-binding protein [Rothia sp. ZJ932]
MSTQAEPATFTSNHHTTAALTLGNVTLEYPDGVDAHGNPTSVRALDNVNFTAHPGTFTALIGQSGSGKSSLLSVASALITPTSGQVLVGNTDISHATDAELTTLRRKEIGIIFQQPNLIASLTAEEQLILAEHIRGARGKELKNARARAQELLELVGLKNQGSRRVHQLSGGQRQRVNIARALMGNPTLLLADEPTSALDHERSVAIVELLQNVTREFGVATIMVTHDVEFAEAADTVATMNDGRLSLQ